MSEINRPDENPVVRNSDQKYKTNAAVHTALVSANPYEPTPGEKAAMKTFRERKNKTARIKTTSTKSGPIELSLEHPDPVYGQLMLMRALAIEELDAFGEVVTQLGTACAEAKGVNERRLNFMIGVIKSVKPKDQLETLLATQIAAIHTLTMDFVSRLAKAENQAQRDSAASILNKLTRTFTVQLETLKRHRSNGEQRLTVHHVSVSQGGQAIVGTVSSGEVGTKEKGQSTP